MSSGSWCLQGSSAGCIYVGSGDPVRVLRLSHNEYTGYTLKHLLLRHMYNLLLPKLCATLLVAGAQLFSYCDFFVLAFYNIKWQHVAPVTLNVCLLCLFFPFPGSVCTTGDMLLVSP